MTLVETIVLGAMEELGQREGCILSLILSLFTPPGEGQRPSRILAQVEQPVPEPRNEGYHNSPRRCAHYYRHMPISPGEETEAPEGEGLCPRSPQVIMA